MVYELLLSRIESKRKSRSQILLAQLSKYIDRTIKNTAF